MSGHYVSAGVSRKFSGRKRHPGPCLLRNLRVPDAGQVYAAECKTPAGIAGGRDPAIVVFPITQLRLLNKDRGHAIEMRSARSYQTESDRPRNLSDDPAPPPARTSAI